MKTKEEILLKNRLMAFDFRGNSTNVLKAMDDYAAEAIKADRESLLNHVYALIKDYDGYIREYVKSEYSVKIDMSEDSPLQYGCSVIVDKDSIINAPQINLL